jgi:hypothetical protein
MLSTICTWPRAAGRPVARTATYRTRRDAAVPKTAGSDAGRSGFCGSEDRLSELLGTQISQRTGLGASPGTAVLREEMEKLSHQILDLRCTLEERDEELAAAREANRKMMAELAKERSLEALVAHEEIPAARSTDAG